MISLTETTTKPILSLTDDRDPEMVDGATGELAAKLHLSLREDSPGLETLSASLTSGNSEAYKRLLAQRDVLQKTQARNDVLAEIIQSDPTKITPEVVDTVRALSEMELKSPNLPGIIEKKYSELYTNTAVASLQEGILEDAVAENPDKAYDMIDRVETVAYKKNIVATEMGVLQKELENQSWTGAIWDFTERLIPFVEWYQKANAVGSESDYVSSILPGNNLEEQYSYLWLMDDKDKFREEFTIALTEMKERNLQTAASWVEGFFSYGGSDAFIDNLFGVADIVGVSPTKTLGNALRGVARAAVKNPMKLEKIAADVGKFDDAAVGTVIRELKEGTFVTPDINNAKALEDSVPSLTSPDKMLVGSQSVPQAAYLRMKEALINNSELAAKFLVEPNLVDRLAPEELLRYKDTLLVQYAKDNPSVQKNVIDAEVSDVADIGNVYQAKIMLGQSDGTLFESAEQAKSFFDKFVKIKDDFEIEQVGEGFRVVVRKNVDESRLFDMKLETNQTSPETLANTFLPWLRSPNYQVSKQNELARSTLVTSTERLREIYEEMAKPFGELSKAERSELEELMVLNRQQHKYYETYGDLDMAFWSKFKKPVSQKQAETYFSYVQMNDLDLIVRDLDWYKQKVAQGRENIKLTMGGESLEFEGKVLDSLPFGQGDFKYTVVTSGKKSKTKSSRFANAKDREELQKLYDQGYKVVQVADQALKIGEKQYTGFVVTNEFSRSRIGVKNIDRVPGGHKVDTYPWYLKQGKFSKTEDSTFYRNDTTLFGVRTEKEARDAAELMERWRQMYNANDPNAMKFLRDNLGISTKRIAAAIKSGDIDPNVPFTATPKGARTLDTGVYSNLPNIEDVSSNPFNLDSRITGKFGGERNETELKVLTSEGDMKFHVEPAEYLAPMETLKMAGSNMVSTRLVHDYTIMTHRNFIREFSDILEGTREELMSSSISALVNPQFKSGANPVRVARAKATSTAYRNLLNMGTDFDRLVEYSVSKLLDSVIPRKGPRGDTRVSDRLISTVKDPGVYWRSTAFHMKLGMFNPVQYFMQANSLVNVNAVAGVNGFRGSLVYPMFRGALLNPDMIKSGAKIAEKVGLMKAEHFEESLRLYQKSGFHTVGRDTAYLDDVAGPEIISTVKGKVLGWGKKPFDEGERLVRTAAWNAAYLEKRQALGHAKMSRRDEADILQRAKDLTANMTRESNAAWQKGYAGIVTQFFGYQARIMEQFLGKKLTRAEKIRLFTGYSAVYGIPVATGATLGIIPARDIILDMLSDNGIQVDDTAIEPFVDGLASAFYEYVFGDEINIADRYGPGGLPTLYDAIRGDSELADLFMGASGAIALDTFASAIPLVRAMYSEFMDFEGGYYNLTKEDFLTPLRNISSVDNATKLWYAYNTGIWASKNGTNLAEIDPEGALLAAVTGLQPAEIEDGFRALKSTQRWKDQQNKWVNEAARDFKEAMRMDPSPERETLVRGIKARMQAQGLSVNQQKEAWRRGADNEMVTDKFFERYEEMRIQKERNTP